MTGMIERLEAMLAAGKDSALLRFSLGSEYLKLGQAVTAASHLAQAVEMQPSYSAAWKLLGKALAETGDRERAIHAYEQGIQHAEKAGDKQAAKEMTVFLRRLLRDTDGYTKAS